MDKRWSYQGTLDCSSLIRFPLGPLHRLMASSSYPANLKDRLEPARPLYRRCTLEHQAGSPAIGGVGEQTQAKYYHYRLTACGKARLQAESER